MTILDLPSHSIPCMHVLDIPQTSTTKSGTPKPSQCLDHLPQSHTPRPIHQDRQGIHPTRHFPKEKPQTHLPHRANHIQGIFRGGEGSRTYQALPHSRPHPSSVRLPFAADVPKEVCRTASKEGNGWVRAAGDGGWTDEADEADTECNCGVGSGRGA